MTNQNNNHFKDQTVNFLDDSSNSGGEYKELVQQLKRDADYTYLRVSSNLQKVLNMLSQKNPKIQKQFDRLLKQSKKHVQLLDKELKNLESSDAGSNSGNK